MEQNNLQKLKNILDAISDELASVIQETDGSAFIAKPIMLDKMANHIRLYGRVHHINGRYECKTELSEEIYKQTGGTPIGHLTDVAQKNLLQMIYDYLEEPEGM